MQALAVSFPLKGLKVPAAQFEQEVVPVIVLNLPAEQDKQSDSRPAPEFEPNFPAMQDRHAVREVLPDDGLKVP